MEPSQLGWRPIRDSWLAALPSTLPEAVPAHLTALTEWLIDPCIAFTRKQCTEPVPTSDLHLVQACLHVIDSQLHVFGAADGSPAAKDELKVRPQPAIIRGFIFVEAVTLQLWYYRCQDIVGC